MEHTTAIHVHTYSHSDTPLKWFAACGCGWTSDSYQDREQAAMAAREHAS